MNPQQQAPPLVIASGDEGLQLNFGTRFGFLGSGYNLPYFAQAVIALQKKLPQKLVLISLQEDDWLAAQLKTKNPNLYQETLQKFARTHKITYVGQLDYGDPRDLGDNLTRGHIVRPQKIHVADQICFTLGGGEQTYNLRQLIISADYLSGLTFKQAKTIIDFQIDFYQKLLNRPLKFTRETKGILDEKTTTKNAAVLDKILASSQTSQK
jgi:hypothetical protein